MNVDSRIFQSSPIQAIPQIVETALHDSALRNSEDKRRRLPAGREKLCLIEAEAGETDKTLKEILEKFGNVL